MPKLFKTVQGKRIEKTPAEIAQEQEAGRQFLRERNLIQERETASQRTAGRLLSERTEAAEAPQRQKEAEAFAVAQETERLKDIETPIPEQEILEGKQPIEDFRNFPAFSAKGISLNVQKSISDIKEKGAIGAFVSQGGDILGRTLGTGARIVDAIQSLWHGTKATPVKQAEAAFLDTTNLINQDIKLVELGQKDYIEVDNNFRLAEGAINRLENYVKNLGKTNLRYWLDDGAEVETQIILEKETLINLRIELELARQKARLSAAKTSLGIK